MAAAGTSACLVATAAASARAPARASPAGRAAVLRTAAACPQSAVLCARRPAVCRATAGHDAAGDEAAPLSRRGLLSALSAAALAAAIADVPHALAEGDVADGEAVPARGYKNVVITGANSGIGLDAAKKLAAKGYRIYLPCRTQAKANAAADEIRQGVDGAFVVPMECDLSSLDSVRAFAADFRSKGEPIDVLVLNAGVQFAGEPEPRTSADGFELTFATNHLGHFLLTNLLLPDVERAGEGARIVITASEVHDPNSAGGAVGLGASLGDFAGLEGGPGFAMVDGGDWDGDKSYKDSKLCNMLFARELERRLEAGGSPVRVNTFGPGLITRTGLFRYQSPLFVGVFDFATNNIFKVAETVSGGGDCLLYMVESPAAPDLAGKGGLYYSNNIKGLGPTATHVFEVEKPSEEALSDKEAKELWDLSSKYAKLA